jgi:hypothetical protein
MIIYSDGTAERSVECPDRRIPVGGRRSGWPARLTKKRFNNWLLPV